ncbi:MAG: hypothetical protein NC121_06015 [Blautia sp.]|nr:hypothetical protein [Blautia sp.]
MGRFQYSEDEMEINKVLKMNQDKAALLLNDTDMDTIRASADSSIGSSVKLLHSLGKDEELAGLSVETTGKDRGGKSDCKPRTEAWNEIAEQADLHEPGRVVLEDILSEGEIRSAFQELDEINRRFLKKTGIANKTDLSFLAVATALQVAKALVFPYVAEKYDYGKSFDPSERLAYNDKKIEETHRNANDKFRDKRLEKHGTGHWINLLYQTVPYDITKGSRDIGKNMGGKYHRMYTLGHDPVLGWVFGTANILTDCITFNDFRTNRISRMDPVTGKSRMIITPETVLIGTMFRECYDEVKADRLNLPAALFAQAQHLKSDEFTKLGLPVPVLSCINENFASKLYSENYDALCFGRDVKIVGASFVISKFFDIIISLTHGLFRREDENKDLYEVRTRKILLISSSIASTSTVINAAITGNPENLDIGSLLNTVTHLFSDLKFMARIKQEYVESEISGQLEKEIAEIDALFNERQINI